MLVPYMLQHNLKKLLIILDSAPPHKAVSLQKYFSSKKIELKMIPDGLTGVLQPGDTHWFSSMKKYEIIHILLFNSKQFMIKKIHFLKQLSRSI